MLNPPPKALPAARAAATILRLASAVLASGFSDRTCNPRSKAAMHKGFTHMCRSRDNNRIHADIKKPVRIGKGRCTAGHGFGPVHVHIHNCGKCRVRGCR